jgi:ParB/RepB/Spo0J family partition protein
MPAVSSRPNKRSFSIPRQSFTQVVTASSLPTPAIYLDVDRVVPNPNNPRRKLGDVSQLAESLDAYGLLQPLVVRESDDAYELIAGHRRLAAIRHLRSLDQVRGKKWRQVAVIVLTADDERALLLAGQENLQRQDLSPRDQAMYLETYVRQYGSIRKAADVLKLSHTYVGQRCRVFADDVLAGPVLANRLDVSSAQELLRVADEKVRSEIVAQAVAGDWSKGRIRHEVDRWNAGIPLIGGRRPIHNKLDGVLRELEAIDPETLTSEEREAAARLLSRLMWMLGPSRAADVDASEDGPVIVNWMSMTASESFEQNADIPPPAPTTAPSTPLKRRPRRAAP